MIGEMELKVVDPLELPDWNDQLADHPDGSFFHTANWARVLSESYRYRPRYFITLNGALQDMIPLMEVRSLLTGNRGVSLPFTDYVAPIGGRERRARDWMRPLIAYGKSSGWKYIEIRNPAPFPDDVPVFSTYHGHVLDIAGGEKFLRAGMRDSTRRNIRKAEKEGVTASCHTTMEALREFYRLNCMTRKEHGLPPQPPRFFRMVYDHVIAKDMGFVTLASYKGRCVAGIVCFHFGGKAIYKYGASDKRYQNLRANNLAMWESILWCVRRGCRSFCFGRTEPDNAGLMQFKAGWGAEERTIRYYRYDLAAGEFLHRESGGESFYNTVFRAMPIPLNRLAGVISYRHAG